MLGELLARAKLCVEEKMEQLRSRQAESPSSVTVSE